MFRYPDGTYKANAPARVEYNGYTRHFADLTREQWDEIGYNEAMPLKREPFTTYETQWVKGDDLVYREKVVSSVVDEAAKTETQAAEVRAERDHKLTVTDWMQLADCPLTTEQKNAWTEYRQALRDIPQQAGFPATVEWPNNPA